MIHFVHVFISSFRENVSLEPLKINVGFKEKFENFQPSILLMFSCKFAYKNILIRFETLQYFLKKILYHNYDYLDRGKLQPGCNAFAIYCVSGQI